jgi:hypothetical protein
LFRNFLSLGFGKFPRQFHRIVIADCLLVDPTRASLIRQTEQVERAFTKLRFGRQNDLHGEKSLFKI